MRNVALTLDGVYLRLEEHGSPRRLHLASAAMDAAAVFERVELGHGRVALRAADGHFLAVHPDLGLSYAVYADAELTPAAAFEEILWPTGQVSLRSCHLTYVGTDATGQVTANRTEAGLRERFFLVPVPAPTVPAQRRPAQSPVAPSTGR